MGKSLFTGVFIALLTFSAPGHAAGPINSAPGRVAHNVDPRMPEGISLRPGETVKCKVLFDVAPGGRPTQVTVTGCDAAFRTEAEAAAWQWHFVPAYVGNLPVAYQFTAILEFTRDSLTGRSTLPYVTTSAGTSPSKLKITKRALPRLPTDFRQRMTTEENGEIRCKVRIDVDAKGVPYDAEVMEAPWDLHIALKTAALQWRFEPVLVDGLEVSFSYIWLQTFASI